MKHPVHQKHRNAGPKAQSAQAQLDLRALELENLRLQREIAKMKAEHVTELNRRQLEREQAEEAEREKLRGFEEKYTEWLKSLEPKPHDVQSD